MVTATPPAGVSSTCFDATILSDEHAAITVDGQPEVWGFTGTLLGLWVQDHRRRRLLR